MITLASTGERVTQAQAMTCAKDWDYAIEVTLSTDITDTHEAEEVRNP
jgi:hypothetical protein